MMIRASIRRWAPLSTSCGIAASGFVAFAASLTIAGLGGATDSADTSTSCDAANGVPRSSPRANPSWINTRDKTGAGLTIHRADTDQETKTGGRFDPAKSDYFAVKLIGRNDHDNTEHPQLVNGQSSQILHNKIAVLPNVITKEDCASIARDTERIIGENKARKVQGRKTESWAVYSRFSSENQQVMDRLLGKLVLEFLDKRMPDVAEKILKGQSSDFRALAQKFGKTNPKEVTSFCWDDPVVIKYDAGNQLAPHEDMRDLTIVVPLNPLENCYHLTGGGTRFWLEGTTPECATADDGVLLKPPAGWGIIFNGDITHSGESVEAGTRFVLMTSIVLDEEEEEEEEEAAARVSGEAGEGEI